MQCFLRSITPTGQPVGLGSSAFARRYLRNRCFFLFLRVLRCFSSPGSPRIAMYLPYAACGLRMRVSPFGHPRIAGYVRLPAAFRSLSRPSSASSAWAFALRPFSLDLTLLFSCLQPFSRLQTVFPRSSIFRCLFFSYLLLALLYMRFSRCVEVFPASPRAYFLFYSGGHLSCHTVSSAVLSAVCVLTVVFGMGTGVSRSRIAARSSSS